MSTTNFKPVYVTVGKSTIRRKVFVDLPHGLGKPCDIDQAVHDAAAELFNQGVIPEGDFPVRVSLFRNFEDLQPIAFRTVDMEVRPQFTVYRMDSET